MKAKLPRILKEWLWITEQYAKARECNQSEELSESHLLEEALWCWYCVNEPEYSGTWGDYHPASKAALKRYIDRLQAKGVKPKHDFEW